MDPPHPEVRRQPRAGRRSCSPPATAARFKGKAWFEGVCLDEASSADAWPAREAVQTFGPAYRYPAAGWIYLHIEGKPYERGYQHGHLMAREIPEYLERCAADLGSNAAGWDHLRTTANALFLRGFDREILEEMRGIADGASDAGAKWLDRRIDLIDIVVANVTVELGELRSAMTATPTGLESLQLRPARLRRQEARFRARSLQRLRRHRPRHARRQDGHRPRHLVAAHPRRADQRDARYQARHRPPHAHPELSRRHRERHRLVSERRRRGPHRDHHPPDALQPEGTPVAFRARMAIQYGGNIDEVVKQLGTRNNGLYTNEWLIGDAKNNEIAMYELGTNHTKLWRSCKNEWFGGTPGFYWGNNNAKDLAIRLENHPDPQGPPDYIPYVPAPRDLAWQDLYRKYRGQIDEQFAFLAFRTAPLVSASTMDAKVATADMANRLMVWAAIGKPNQREWVPGGRATQRTTACIPAATRCSPARPRTNSPKSSRRASIPNRPSPDKPPPPAAPRPARPAANTFRDRLWKGWIVPAADSDTWFAAGTAAYRDLLESDDLEKALEARRIQYRGLKLAPDNAINRFRIEETKGVLFLDSLRRKLGDDSSSTCSPPSSQRTPRRP